MRKATYLVPLVRFAESTMICPSKTSASLSLISDEKICYYCSNNVVKELVGY